MNDLMETLKQSITGYLADNDLRNSVDFSTLGLGTADYLEKAVVWLSLLPEAQFDDPVTCRIDLSSQEVTDMVASTEVCGTICDRWMVQLTTGETDWADDLPLLKSDEQAYHRLDDLMRKELDSRRLFTVDIEKRTRNSHDRGFIFEVALSLEEGGEAMETYRLASANLSRQAFQDVIRDEELRSQLLDTLLDHLQSHRLLGDE